MTDSKLPDFKTPPVTEVVVGVQFTGIALQNIHLGALWSTFQERYSRFEQHPPLAPTFETFGAPQPQAPFSLNFMFGQSAVNRHWFVEADEHFLVQIQGDKFFLNWRRQTVDEVYPRFHVIFDRFKQELGIFSDYCEKNNLGRLLINQCEVTYINQVVFPDEPHPHSKIGDVVLFWSEEFRTHGTMEFESGNAAARFLVSDGEKHVARLHAEIMPIVRTEDGLEALQFQMTCRGKPDGENFESTEKLLSICHEAIVIGFDNLTTKKMHNAWGRKD